MFGKYWIFCAKLNGCWAIEMFSSMVWSINDVVDDADDKLGNRVLGSFNMNKNVMSWMVGTRSIRRSVAFGVKPIKSNAVYDKDPVTPAAPVPDAHAIITFLSRKIKNRNKHVSFTKSWIWTNKIKCIYLLNFVEYANIDVSPKPLLQDVIMMPRIACHLCWADATIT